MMNAGICWRKWKSLTFFFLSASRVSVEIKLQVGSIKLFYFIVCNYFPAIRSCCRIYIMISNMGV